MKCMFCSIGVVVLILGATLPAYAASSSNECENPKPKGRERPLTEEEKLARDYGTRRRGGDNRNCPCAGNPGQYCSCDSYRGNDGYGYGYGYGHWGGYGHYDPYATGNGWSRSNGYGSDIPTSGYTPNAPR